MVGFQRSAKIERAGNSLQYLKIRNSEGDVERFYAEFRLWSGLIAIIPDFSPGGGFSRDYGIIRCGLPPDIHEFDLFF